MSDIKCVAILGGSRHAGLRPDDRTHGAGMYPCGLRPAGVRPVQRPAPGTGPEPSRCRDQLCGLYTNVDGAESDQETAYRVNAEAVAPIGAVGCTKADSGLAH